MSSRTHFAAPLLLAIIVALILYVSLYPFQFGAEGPPAMEVLRELSWARASRGDMFNNVLLYVPLGFCIALAVEPRFGRLAGISAGLVGGALLSITMEIMQGSIATRVPSLTDLSLNAAGAFAGAIGGSAWHALGARMTPQANPAGRSGAIALVVLVLWLIARLWPFVPDASLRQLKRAVRPLFSPEIGWPDLAAFFVGWLVVAQAVFHLARRQRSVDVFLIVIAAVLVGRTFTAGNTLEFAELAAIALLLPVLVLISRVEDRGRSALLAAALGTWLASIALLPALEGARGVSVEVPGFAEFLSRNAPPPAELAGRAFSYVALTWLLAGTGLFPHVAAGITVLLVVLLGLLQAGAVTPVYGWIDVVLAIIAGILVTRWQK
jgi:VanZ family protein/heme/copper-type cytochrome/quinol oxidase subunit 3